MDNGILKIYNRLPRRIEWQLDQVPYGIDAHAEAHVTYPVAVMAIKKSMYYMDFNDVEDVRYGIVPEQDPDFGKPLSEEEVAEAQQIEGVNYGLELPLESYHVERVKYGPGELPQRRRRASKDIQITASASEGT